MVLQTLKTMGPLHGYGIARRIEQISEDVLKLNQGTILRVAHAPAAAPLDFGDLGRFRQQPRREVDAITRAGRRQLAAEADSWARIARDHAPAPPRKDADTLWLQVLISRIQTLFTRGRLDADLRLELEHHVRLAAADNERRGMGPEEARRQARLRLGGSPRSRSRTVRRAACPGRNDFQDLLYVVRALRRSPAFTAVAILTLGVGIGATTAMFSVLHAVLLRPLPYSEPDRLVEIFETNPLKGWARNVVAAANYADWRRMNTVFTDIAATNGSGDRGEGRFDAFLTGTGEPLRVKALQTTGNLFRVLGAAPLFGRTFTDEETFEGKARVAILGYGLWRSMFAADPHVVGRTIELSGRAYEVVGVMPPAFFYPSRDIELWVPVGYKPSLFTGARRPHWLRTVARLKPGVRFEDARDEMQRIAAELERTYPATNTKMGVRLEPLHDAFAFGTKAALFVLFAAVGAVFLVVCVNIAGLQLGRAAGRARRSRSGAHSARHPVASSASS